MMTLPMLLYINILDATLLDVMTLLSDLALISENHS